jgi:hypothetical protein
VDDLVEPPVVRVPAEVAEDDRVQLPLLVDLERRLQAGVVDGIGRRFLDQRRELALQLVEDLRDLGRLHPLLIVVEQDVVGLAVEALDVAELQVEVLLQMRQERVEVRVRACLDPDGKRLGGGVSHLAAQLGRHLALLLPVTARDADQARLVRIGIEALLVRLQLLEQAPDFRRREPFVDDPLERRRLLRPEPGGPGRHQRLLVPVEVGRDAGKVHHLAESPLQLIELLVHDSPFRPRARRSASHPAIRKPIQIGVKRT